MSCFFQMTVVLAIPIGTDINRNDREDIKPRSCEKLRSYLFWFPATFVARRGAVERERHHIKSTPRNGTRVSSGYLAASPIQKVPLLDKYPFH